MSEKYFLTDSITKIESLSQPQLKGFSKLGIENLEDLLYFFPNKYEDFSYHKKIDRLTIGEVVTLKGVVIQSQSRKSWKRRVPVTEAYLQDETGVIKIIWFGFIKGLNYIKKGSYLQVSGKTSLDKKNELILSQPNLEPITKKQIKPDEEQIIDLDQDNPEKPCGVNTGCLVPLYSQTKGITSFLIRDLIKKALEKTEIIDFLPRQILKEEGLETLEKALWQIHFPDNKKTLNQAKKRFAFEKIFLIQLKALMVTKKWKKNLAHQIPFKQTFVKKVVDGLPFKLTNSQKKTIWQVIQDIKKNTPMNRLIEGDVGSGKTVIANISAFCAVEAGYQVAFLAPTEILAIQHFKEIQKILKNSLYKSNIKIGLLTGGKKIFLSKEAKGPSLKNKISNGKVNLLVGTHALLQQSVKFKNLSLIIIDEQHRFGVKQRAFLQQNAIRIDDGSKQTIPHLLTMTATPIPRTLSIAIFGNLDLSIIDEYPQGRKKIKTKIVSTDGREQVYFFIKKELSRGRQAFVVCPLVEDSSKMSLVKSAQSEQKRLEKIFPEFKLGLLHGKMKPKEKEKIMTDFKDKKIDMLISTSVIEVGVDVPNATIMIIEGAERFGLSQLHQFRGRVGRGEYQSYCFLFTSENTTENNQRLDALEKTNDGFRLAKYDLEIRGPGQLMGTLQSGKSDIAMESLSDVKIIKKARDQAFRLLEFNPKLDKFLLIKNKVIELEKDIHFE